MKKLFCLLCLPVALVLSGASAPTPPADVRPLATVNEEPILPSDLERQLARIHESVDSVERSAFDRDRLMFKLVNDVLIGQEARSSGMAEEPELLQQMAEYRDELIYKYLEKMEIAEHVQPEPEAVQRLFHEQYNEMQLRVITSYEEADAREILAKLRQGADMEALAREYSVDHIAARGGLMKSAPRIDLHRGVAAVAFTLEVHEIGGPVQTDLGWTVFRVEAKTNVDPVRFEKLEGRLGAILRHEKARSLREVLARTARKHHPVVLDQELVKEMQPVRQPDARLVAEAPDPDAVVARVGEHRTVRAGEYAYALGKRWKGVRNEEAAVAAAPIILSNLIEYELLVAEGERRGYGELPVVQALLHSRETQLLVPRYLEEVVAAGIGITPEEMQEYYDEHKNQYLRPPRVRLGQITVATMGEAEKVARLLRDGADIAWVAQQYSTDGFKDQGGMRGWMVPTPGLDALQDRLLEGQAGDILDPFGVEGNYIVLKMLAREEQGPFEFEQISGNVRQTLFTDKFRVVLDRFITTLRERSEIVLHDDRIQALEFSGSFVKQTEEDDSPGGHGH